MDKKPRNESPDLELAHRGMIPWSAKEFHWAYAKQSESKLKSVSSFNDVLVLAEIFQSRYPDDIVFKAHMYRFHLIKTFIFKHAIELMKDGFAAPKGEAGFRSELMDVLCTLPYSEQREGKDGDITYTFSYTEVKKAALKKMNAHLN